MSADVHASREPQPLRPVALLRTPFLEKFGVPRQSGLVPEAEGFVVFTPEFARDEFVRGLEAFSHIWLITQFHQNNPWAGTATVRPPRLGGNDRVGVFASRSPNRPNGLGLSLVRLIAVEKSPSLRLRVAGIDAVEGTPVFDVKPYLPWCEAPVDARADWAQAAPAARAAENVFIPPELALQVLHASPETGAATLALVRHLLQHNHQPAYQHDLTRLYGMSVAGWNVRWRQRAGDRIEVCSFERLGAV
jgi:tRNA-Thr(GGU) m(6)t(6)A37 methyltransferase TsaA